MRFVEIVLDEDYIFLIPGGRLEIPVYGTIVIRYESVEDWRLDAVTICASNGKTGDACENFGWAVEKSHPMFTLVERWLEMVAEERVEDAIHEDIQAQRESYLLDEGKERAKFRSTIH